MKARAACRGRRRGAADEKKAAGLHQRLEFREGYFGGGYRIEVIDFR